MFFDIFINDVVFFLVYFFNVFDCLIGVLLFVMFKKKNLLYFEIINWFSMYVKVLCEYGWIS